MARLPLPALLAALGLLGTGCTSTNPKNPPLPSDVICCVIAKPVPAAYLRTASGSFKQTQLICLGETPPLKYTILAGFDRLDGDRPLFGCLSQASLACERRDNSVCCSDCILNRTCYYRSVSGRSFLEEERIQKNVLLRGSSDVGTTNTSQSTSTDRLDNGTTVIENVSDLDKVQVSTEVVERRRSISNSLNLNVNELPSLGSQLLQGPDIRPDVVLQRPISATSGTPNSPSVPSRATCCTAPTARIPRPLAGVSSLAGCQDRCQALSQPLAVHLGGEKWACAELDFQRGCTSLPCSSCSSTPNCLKVYQISLALEMSTTTLRNSRFGTDLTAAGTQNTTTIDRIIPFGMGSGLTRVRHEVNASRTEISGGGNLRQTFSLQSNFASNTGLTGDRSIDGLTSIESSTSIGSRRTQRNDSQTHSIRDRAELRQNLTAPDIQVGFRASVVTDDVTTTSNRQRQTNETTKAVRRAASSRGDRRAELAAGLLAPQNGNASLGASEAITLQQGSGRSLEASVQRRSDSAELITKDGVSNQARSEGITVKRELVLTASNANDTVTNANFTRQDPNLGQIGLKTSTADSSAVLRKDTAATEMSGESSRSLTRCAECGTTVDTTARTESRSNNRSQELTDAISKTTQQDNDIRPGGGLPDFRLSTRQVRSAMTKAGRSVGSGVTRNVSTSVAEGPGFRKNVTSDSETSVVITTQENVEEVKNSTTLKVVVSG